MAAVSYLRPKQPGAIILAVPVASDRTAEVLRAQVDEFTCPEVRSDFRSVSQFYGEFPQTTDEEVKQILSEARRPRGGPGR